MGGFDCSIQRQQVCPLRNILNNADHLLDTGDLGADAQNPVVGQRKHFPALFRRRNQKPDVPCIAVRQRNHLRHTGNHFFHGRNGTADSLALVFHFPVQMRQSGNNLGQRALHVFHLLFQRLHFAIHIRQEPVHNGKCRIRIGNGGRKLGNRVQTGTEKRLDFTGYTRLRRNFRENRMQRLRHIRPGYRLFAAQHGLQGIHQTARRMHFAAEKHIRGVNQQNQRNNKNGAGKYSAQQSVFTTGGNHEKQSGSQGQNHKNNAGIKQIASVLFHFATLYIIQLSF